MKKILFVSIVLLVLVSSLVSCSSKPPTKLNVTLSEFKFDPMENTIAAGKEITLKIKNVGADKHEYVIMKKGMTAGEKFGPEDEENIYWEVEVEAGQSTSTTFTAPTDPGDYEIVCGTEGHLEQGMRGKLTVVAAN